MTNDTRNTLDRLERVDGVVTHDAYSTWNTTPAPSQLNCVRYCTTALYTDTVYIPIVFLSCSPWLGAARRLSRSRYTAGRRFQRHYKSELNTLIISGLGYSRDRRCGGGATAVLKLPPVKSLRQIRFGFVAEPNRYLNFRVIIYYIMKRTTLGHEFLYRLIKMIDNYKPLENS